MTANEEDYTCEPVLETPSKSSMRAPKSPENEDITSDHGARTAVDNTVNTSASEAKREPSTPSYTPQVVVKSRMSIAIVRATHL